MPSSPAIAPTVPPGGLPARIAGTGRHQAGDEVRTVDLVAGLGGARDPEDTARRIGIASRRWDRAGSLAGLAIPALRAALDDAGIPARALRRVILATSTGGDQLIPSTATTVAQAFGLSDEADCFDVNNACTGFLNGLDVAARSVATGLGPVAVIGAERLSPYLRPDTPRSYLVLADAAAAVIVDAPRGGGRVRASWTSMRKDLSGDMRTPHPGLTGRPAAVTFDAPLGELAESAVRAIRDAGEVVLAQSGLGWSEVDWFLPHQPNGSLFQDIVAACGVPPERTVPVADTLGSVAAASVPFSLDALRRSGRLRPGQRVLMAAVGAGTGFGAMLWEEDG